MKNKTKFYVCEHCGNIVEMINDSGVRVVCCGQKMTPIEAGVVEASREKHIPVAKIDGNHVDVLVGSVEHPMSAEHSILWIYLETDKGSYRVNLSPSDAPKASFILDGEKPISVYAYCNLHGLWKYDFEN